MARPVSADLDFQGVNTIENLPDAVSNNQPVTLGQVLAIAEGISWKSSVRTASTANLNLSAPGAAIGGVTMDLNDPFLAKDQTTTSQNGLYIWNGASSPATRAPNADTFEELEGAVVKIEEGDNAGTQWRQTSVNGTLGSTAVIWIPDSTSVPNASTTVAGVVELGTQAEIDAGNASVVVTGETLANYEGLIKKLGFTFGDGAATSFTLTHNLNTMDVMFRVYNASSGAEPLVEVSGATVNTITVVFQPAPALNSMKAVVMG